MGVLVLESKGEEAPPYKELGLSDLVLVAPWILHVGILYVYFLPFQRARAQRRMHGVRIPYAVVALPTEPVPTLNLR